MSGEQNLQKILSGLMPVLADKTYVFTTVDMLNKVPIDQVFACIKEAEAYTLILEQELADHFNLPYDYVAAKITIQIHSALDGVGLTAALSTQLANHHISCNIIAGFYHDHLFVDYDQGATAVKLLLALRT